MRSYTRRAQNGVLRVLPLFYLGLAVVLSFLFIITISCSFNGAAKGRPYFKDALDQVAQSDTPGIVLLGDDVDVDVDEPSIGFRWSVLGCGEGYMLEGSRGAHGSELCGLPSMPLMVFVDGGEKATFVYDPESLPVDRDTGQRLHVQRYSHFDSDHVLDVPEAHLYPFDTYAISSSMSLQTFNNTSVPLRKLGTIGSTSSFTISSTDFQSYSYSSEDASVVFEVRVRRPLEARMIALLLFALNWMLTHIVVGQVILCRRLSDSTSILKHILSAGAILVIVPQLRNSMPDAPDLDGVLIDTIGFFPQMIVTGLCATNMLLILIARELSSPHQSRPAFLPPTRSVLSQRTSRPPSSPTERSSSREIAQYEVYRLMNYLNGQYVFPPVDRSVVNRYKLLSKLNISGSSLHRRAQTVTNGSPV